MAQLEGVHENPHHLRMVSKSDVFTPAGRTKIGVVWDLSVKKIDDKTCESTSMVDSSATPAFVDFLGKRGIPWEVSRLSVNLFQRLLISRRRLFFAKSIERQALRRKVKSTAA